MGLQVREPGSLTWLDIEWKWEVGLAEQAVEPREALVLLVYGEVETEQRW